METKEKPCRDCKDLISQGYLAPHKQLLEMSVMPDHKLYNCIECGSFPTLNLDNAVWEVEELMPIEVES